MHLMVGTKVVQPARAMGRVHHERLQVAKHSMQDGIHQLPLLNQHQLHYQRRLRQRTKFLMADILLAREETMLVPMDQHIHQRHQRHYMHVMFHHRLLHQPLSVFILKQKAVEKKLMILQKLKPVQILEKVM